MNFKQENLFKIKEHIQDLEDEKTNLINKTLIECGWEYLSHGLFQQLWRKSITVEGENQYVHMNKNDAWTFELINTLNNPNY